MPLGVVSTHPAAQAIGRFADDFPLALLRQQPSSAAGSGTQHTPQLQHTLLGAVLLVPIVLEEAKGKVSFAQGPRVAPDELVLPEASGGRTWGCVLSLTQEWRWVVGV